MRYSTSYIHVVVGNCSCIAQGAYFWFPITYMAQASLSTGTRSDLLPAGACSIRATGLSI